jgi:CHASE3 domain sensor protein
MATDAAFAKRTSRRNELVLGVCLFFGLLVVNAVAGRQTQQLHADAQLILHTHQVMEALDDLLATVKDAESGQRGYLITGENSYLKSYDAAIAATKEKIVQIEQLIKSSPQELNRIPRLQTAINLEVKELANAVEVRRRPAFDSKQLVVLTDHEEQTMNSVEGEVHSLHDFEEGVLESEEQTSDNDYRWAVMTIGLSALLALAIFAGFVWLVRRHAVERREASMARRG